MRDGHLLKRAGTEFVRNLTWMAVVFGSLAAILAAVTDLSLVEVMAFVGVCVAVMAAIVTVVVLWSGPTRSRAPVDTPTLARLPKPAAVIGPVAVGGMVAEEETAAAGELMRPLHRSISTATEIAAGGAARLRSFLSPLFTGVRGR